jgi:hypothetical protein
MSRLRHVPFRASAADYLLWTMKKLLILSLICIDLVGLGNVFSRSLSSLLSPSPAPTSGWAMFKELFQ